MAVETEIERQIREVSAGRAIETWTLQWDEDGGTLRKMRSKESEADYRYFREPDLLPIVLDEEWRAEILSRLPELPLARRERFVEEYKLPLYDAEILTEERSFSEYFEEVVSIVEDDAKTVSNWLINDVQRMIRELCVSPAKLKLRPHHLAKIIQMVQEKAITTNTGKDLLMKVEQSGQSPEQLVADLGLAQVSDEDTLREVAAKIIAENPEQVRTYQGGKKTILGWFVGQIMRETKGKANPQKVRSILEDLLAE